MKPRSDAGMTLVEIIISLGVMAIALVGLVSVIVHTTRHNAMMRENLVAMRAAEKQLELIQSTPFDTIFQTFSTTTMRVFKVSGLVPAPGYTEVGAIRFPTDATGFQLREDKTGALMGGGPNLDMDGDNNPNETTDLSIGQVTYTILPVAIELNWKGIHGKRQLIYRQILLKK